MRTPGWQRIAARAVLITFTTVMTACGGSQGQPPPPPTTIAPPPTAPPPTAPPPTQPPAPPPTQPPVPPPTEAAPPPTLPAQAPDQLGKKELRDLVAPVALYPDVVLASLLPATTNPDQIHDAAMYIGQSQRVEQVPENVNWDGSVVGLLQFPDVLRWLDQNPAWTDEMGQAVTYQQGDVLDAIQDYRRLVRDAGNLKSNQYQVVRGGAQNEDIYIEPARPDIVYVPSYDPEIAVQPQPVETAPGINPWIAFGGGAVVGALGAWALYSIFDRDEGDHVTVNNYYGGGGRRRIRAYENYYYARGRRPRPLDWTPRQRERRARIEGWQHPRRLEHRAQAAAAPGPNRAGLRPPTMRPGMQAAPRPGEVRREQRMERRDQRQENRQERQQQRIDQRQQRQENRQENRTERRDMRQQNREQNREQRQENRQERQQQRQGNRPERQQQRFDQRQQRQENRQEQRQQRQENRQQQQQQRQQHQEQRQEQRQQQRQERQQQRPEHHEQGKRKNRG